MGPFPSSVDATPRPPAATLPIVGADSRDSTDNNGAPVSVVPAGKIAAAARARALAGQVPEASARQRPSVLAIELHPTDTSLAYGLPEDQYADTSRPRISVRMSVPNTAPPLYSE
jgi:hypothetical protein